MTQVAAELDVAISTVVSAAARFRSDGVDGLYDRRRNNGARKVDVRFERALVRVLERSPEFFGWQRPTWTRELLCAQMALEGFCAVAVCTMGRALSRVGARLGSAKPIVLCPWSREREDRALSAIRDLEARASSAEPVLYVDEVDIHLNPRIGRDWMLRGRQRRIVTPGKNKKFYIAGALDVRTGRLHTTGSASKNAGLFCQLLWLLATRYRRARRVHLVLDNYAIHSARRTQKVLAALGGRIALHFLPPYCPDHNRIERVWQDLHANVTRNHRCKTIRHLLEKVRRYVDAYRWRRVTGSRVFLHAA
jgi:transposase